MNGTSELETKKLKQFSEDIRGIFDDWRLEEVDNGSGWCHSYLLTSGDYKIEYSMILSNFHDVMDNRRASDYKGAKSVFMGNFSTQQQDLLGKEAWSVIRRRSEEEEKLKEADAEEIINEYKKRREIRKEQ